MATDEYLRWEWNICFDRHMSQNLDIMTGHEMDDMCRQFLCIDLIMLAPGPPPAVINITGPNRRLRIFMQLTWSPFIISPGPLFNIGRRKFCGFTKSQLFLLIFSSPPVWLFFPPFFSICDVQHFYTCIFYPFVLAFQFVPIWPNFCIFMRILSVFVRTFHALQQS